MIITSPYIVIRKFLQVMTHPRRKLLLYSINRAISYRMVLSSESGAYRITESYQNISSISSRGARMCPEQTGEISDHIGYQKGLGEIVELLENCVPLFRARRPDGYEKYEIWFSRILNGVQVVSLAHRRAPPPSRSLSRSVAPHAYRGRISGPAGRPLSARQQDIVH